MSTHRLRADHVGDAVLRGDAEGLLALGRPDLVDVAAALAPLRPGAPAGPVRPSADLALLLEHGPGQRAGAGELPAAAHHLRIGSDGVLGRLRRHRSTTGRKLMITEWLGGLGLAAKISLASAVAAASVGITGAAGVLPTPVQDDFDAVVSHVTPFSAGADDAPADTGIDVETPAAPSDDPTPGGGASPSDDPTTPGVTPTDDATTDGATPSDDRTPEAAPSTTHDEDEADDDGHRRGDDKDGRPGKRKGDGKGKGNHGSKFRGDERSSDRRHGEDRHEDADDRSGRDDRDDRDEADDRLSSSHEDDSDADDRSGSGHEDEPEDGEDSGSDD